MVTIGLNGCMFANGIVTPNDVVPCTFVVRMCLMGYKSHGKSLVEFAFMP